MKYALNLAEDGRVLSASFYNEYSPKDAHVVDELPDDNIVDYRFIDGEYVHDPLPKHGIPEPEPSMNDILNVLLGVTE